MCNGITKGNKPQMKLQDILRLNARYGAKYSQAQKDVARERIAIRSERRAVSVAIKSQTILQNIAKKTQETVHKQLSYLVSKCLKAVFDDPYTFRIIFDKKRGKTEARLVFIRKDLELDPTTACGGGVLDVAAFALRLSCLMLQRPRKRKILFLDEPFRFLSEKKEYRQKVRDLLETLARDLKVQLVTITHDPILEVGRVISID